jgi:hypothetical protein
MLQTSFVAPASQTRAGLDASDMTRRRIARTSPLRQCTYASAKAGLKALAFRRCAKDHRHRVVRAAVLHIDDGRKTWKLTDMDLKSYSRWSDYSRARDEMFLATDTSWAPWYVVHSDNKRRARLNALTHILSKIPYEEPSRPHVKLPKRQEPGDYKASDYPFRVIPEVF